MITLIVTRDWTLMMPVGVVTQARALLCIVRESVEKQNKDLQVRKAEI